MRDCPADLNEINPTAMPTPNPDQKKKLIITAILAAFIAVPIILARISPFNNETYAAPLGEEQLPTIVQIKDRAVSAMQSAGRKLAIAKTKPPAAVQANGSPASTPTNAAPADPTLAVAVETEDSAAKPAGLTGSANDAAAASTNATVTTAATAAATTAAVTAVNQVATTAQTQQAEELGSAVGSFWGLAWEKSRPFLAQAWISLRNLAGNFWKRLGSLAKKPSAADVPVVNAAANDDSENKTAATQPAAGE